MPSKNEIMANPGSGALPGGGQAQGQAPFGSASPDAIFGSLTQGMPQVTQQDIQAAITPISGRGPIQMPSYFTTPRAQVQPPAQMNREQVIGAGNGRAQGIGNTVSAATRLIGNIVATKKLQKQEADATRVQQLLSAQYSVDSTQQQLKGMKPSDPGYAELQKQAKDSQTLIAGLMQDPKFVKQVEKGFQVSLTDPSQNKTPDHNLVQRGIDLFKKKHQENISQEQAQQMAQRFSQSQPKQLQPNVQAQQNLQMKMEMQKQQTALYRSMLPSLIRERQAKDTQDREDYRAKLREGGENARSFAHILGQFKLEDVKHLNALNLASVKYGLALRNAEKVLSNREADPSKLMTARDHYDRESTESVQAQQKLVLSLTQDRDVYQSSKHPDKTVLEDKNKKIYEAGEDLRKMQTARTVGMQQFSDRITGKVNLDGTSTGSGTGSNDGGGSGTGGVATDIRDADDLDTIYSALGLARTEDDQ